MGPSDTQDAGFFTLVHSLLKDKPADDKSAERRTNGRRPFRCVQRIAVCPDGRIPARDDFHPIECYDLSPSGFSYLSDRAPEATSLMVALGDSTTSETLLAAEVINVAPAPAGAESRYRIGCRFTGRVQ